MVKLPDSTVLPVSFLQEGDQFVAYSPALNLSTAGGTIEEARKNFVEAATIFLKELAAMGTAEEVLLDLGWQKSGETIAPPRVVSQEIQTLTIPA